MVSGVLFSDSIFWTVCFVKRLSQDYVIGKEKNFIWPVNLVDRVPQDCGIGMDRSSCGWDNLSTNSPVVDT